MTSGESAVAMRRTVSHQRFTLVFICITLFQDSRHRNFMVQEVAPISVVSVMQLYERRQLFTQHNFFLLVLRFFVFIRHVTGFIVVPLLLSLHIAVLAHILNFLSYALRSLISTTNFGSATYGGRVMSNYNSKISAKLVCMTVFQSLVSPEVRVTKEFSFSWS